MSAPAVDISVVVATRDRAAVLPDALESLAKQRTDGFTYEVLVVDNGSTDDTARVIEGFAQRYQGRFRLVREARPGKPYAVNTGLGQARGSIIALTDDDVIADDGWLAAMWRCFQETDAEAISGPIRPLWVDGRPEWLTDKVMRHLGALGLADFGPSRFDVKTYRKHFWWVGSNIGLRREPVRRLGGYDIRLLRAQDTELFRRYHAAGVRILYEPAAVVHHKVTRDRLTPDYFRRWYGRTGYFRAFSRPWRKYHLVTVVPVQWYQEVGRLVVQWWKAGRSESPFWERLGYECRLRAALHEWWHRLRLWPHGVKTVFSNPRQLHVDVDGP
jgi:glycosyltransferase involved in cell wall biosynthesis